MIRNLAQFIEKTPTSEHLRNVFCAMLSHQVHIVATLKVHLGYNGEKESAGQILSTLLPDGAKLAKALGTLSVASLAKAAHLKPEQAVLFYAKDDASINQQIEELIRDNGCDPVRIGGIDLMKRFVDFINTASEPLASELMSPNAIFYVPELPEPMRGPAVIWQLLE